jgi:hypothetical protein
MALISCVTNKGLNIIASRLKGLLNEPVYFGWGTGVGNADPTDTELFEEASEPRITLATEIDTVGSVGDSYKLTGAMVANADKVITNWGLFDASSGGNMFLHESIIPGASYKFGHVEVLLFRVQIVRGA